MTPERWNELSVEERVRLLHRSDRSMRDPRWANLVRTVSENSFEALTSIQQDLVRSFS